MFCEGDHVVAHRPGRSRASALQVMNETSLLCGSEEKSRIGVKLQSEKRERDLSLVAKRVGVLGSRNRKKYSGLSDTEAYYMNWKMLKEAGIPTVPTVRIVDEDVVVLTDMTAKGGMFFGKETNLNEIELEKISDVEMIFAQMDLRPVKEELLRIERLALVQRIKLPIDDPFDLLVHPDGSWEVVVLDLGWAEKDADENAVFDGELFNAGSFFGILAYCQWKYCRLLGVDDHTNPFWRYD